MAAHGPVPKRSAELRRRNKPDVPTKKTTVSGKVSVPAAGRNWHPLANRLYQALKDSGQSKFYEPSDWAAAHLVCENLTRDLGGSDAINAASFAAYLKAFAVLGVTEGDRRRIGIEVDRKPTGRKAKPARVVAMDDYRDSLSR